MQFFPNTVNINPGTVTFIPELGVCLVQFLAQPVQLALLFTLHFILAG